MEILRIKVENDLMFIEVKTLNKSDSGRIKARVLIRELIEQGINVPNVIRVRENILGFGYIFYSFSKYEFI